MIVRAKFVDPTGDWDPLCIDLLVADGQIVAGGPFCGWWGAIKSTDLMPFVAKPKADGSYVIDFGSDEDTDQTQRLHALRLPDDRVRPGCKLSFDFHEELVPLVAEAVVDLVTGQSVD
jgi:hypothetical protein